MTAVTVISAERIAPASLADAARPDMTRGGIASSAVLHLGVLVLVVVGLPSLFHHPPPQEQPIAVELVMIAPETKATHPNPYKPRPDAKPEPPIAAPAPKPEPKPEPPVPEPPAAAAAPTPPPPPEPPKPEIKAPPAPPPKPVEAQAPPLPPPPEPKPKPDIRQAHHAPRPAPPSKADSSAFENLMKNLEQHPQQPVSKVRHVEKRQEKAFDALLQNLTPEQTAEAEDAPPRPHKMAATAPPSSQPKAPLGSQLTASDIDLVRERLRPCFNPPFGAKEKPDLIADIRVVMNRDGTVQQARVADTGQYNSDQIYRAVADAGIRALHNERCSPLPLPADRFDVWQAFVFGFSTKDMQ